MAPVTHCSASNVGICCTCTIDDKTIIAMIAMQLLYNEPCRATSAWHIRPPAALSSFRQLPNRNHSSLCLAKTLLRCKI
jgi:hypothetical protein